MKPPSSPPKPHFLGRGVQEVFEHAELNRRLYWIFSSMEKFHKEIQDCGERREALLKLMQFVEGMEVFHETALYAVDEENWFVLEYISEPNRKQAIEAFVTEQMKSGQFAWALQQNRETIVAAPEGFPGPKMVFHGLSTRQTTIGMFVGCPKNPNSVAMSTLYRMLSLMIDSAVYALENRKFENELKEHNRKLEKMVENRTQELVKTNQQMHQANVQLKKLNEKKTEFLGIVAHDLKNPLAGISGLTQLIELSIEESRNGREFDYENCRKMLEQVQISAGHMTEALNELMQSEAIESGQIRLEVIPIDIGKIARKVAIINHPQANAKSIQINCEIEDDLMVLVDPVRIQEAIDNLVSNAIKYSPIGSVVEVMASLEKHKEERVYVRVRDEGPGLTEDDKNKLFGRFQKLSARPTAGESSTGLGLSIFKQLVDLHHGEVRVRSESGKGAEFGFSLPLHRAK